MNGLTLAYLGDSYYELEIRKYLVTKGITNVNKLHKSAVMYTSSIAQAHISKYLSDQNLLTEEEISLFKRGRNSSGPGRKNVDKTTYQNATGFEALIGALSLQDEKRAKELIAIGIDYIERGEDNGQSK